MAHPDNLTSTRTTVGTRYTERLSCPWWAWVPLIALVTVLALEVGLGADGPRTWLPPVLLVPLTLAGLWWLGRIRISVTDAELLVDDAKLPLGVIADAIPLTAAERRTLLGPAADPLAFVIQRPWVSGAVQIVLADPDDPTPYWVISSRHPDKLAALLTSGARLLA